MNDRELFYSILGREIDNFLSINPSFAFLSSGIKRYIFNLIDPYVSLFIEDKELKIDMAGTFVKNELSNKIDNFKKNFKETKSYEENK